jgi:O-antigen/teichoic acid export membrane protein
MKIKYFLITSSDIERDSFLWNMAGSLIMAFQSVIFLMILTRTVGLTEAGIFTIAYADANLFLNIGKYGMRYYQVSDVKKTFSFQEYRISRWITSATMIIVSLLYLIYTSSVHQYTYEKFQIILWMCFFKVPDAYEDIYYGEYQRKGRLDIASKAMTLRMFITMLIYGILLILLENQLYALIISTCFTYLIMILLLKWTRQPFPEIQKTSVNKTNILHLLKECLPLFAGAFLSFYIGNAPKYAIDAQMSDTSQACYGFIAMPVFIIGLLNSMIFNPMLFHLSCMWNEHKYKAFLKKIGVQMLYVIGITAVCILGAWLVGIPVLSWLYNTDLSSYKTELIILLLGGGFLGASGFLNAILTIMRCQKEILIGYLVASAGALFLSNTVIKNYGINGASWLYLILMVILCLCFDFTLFIKMYKQKSLFF